MGQSTGFEAPTNPLLLFVWPPFAAVPPVTEPPVTEPPVPPGSLVAEVVPGVAVELGRRGLEEEEEEREVGVEGTDEGIFGVSKAVFAAASEG